MLRRRALIGLLALAALILASSPVAIADRSTRADDADQRPGQVTHVTRAAGLPQADRHWVALMLKAQMRVIGLPDAPRILPAAARIYAADDRRRKQRLTAILVDFSSVRAARRYRGSHRPDSNTTILIRHTGVSIIVARSDNDTRRAGTLVRELRACGWR